MVLMSGQNIVNSALREGFERNLLGQEEGHWFSDLGLSSSEWVFLGKGIT